jgi:hypothetical protein
MPIGRKTTIFWIVIVAFALLQVAVMVAGLFGWLS